MRQFVIAQLHKDQSIKEAKEWHQAHHGFDAETSWLLELLKVLDPYEEVEFIEADCDPTIPNDYGYGQAINQGFMCWTNTTVYFDDEYDGSQWLNNVPRHP